MKIVGRNLAPRYIPAGRLQLRNNCSDVSKQRWSESDAGEADPYLVAASAAARL
jgi:hypothetical protein